MKTVRLQFNAKTFKGTRDIINAYISAKFELAKELDAMRRATADLSKVIGTDRDQLACLVMGKTEDTKGSKILRNVDTIRKSLETNVVNYNTMIAPYNALVDATSDAIGKAVALFNNKDSALYKAYVAYVTDTTDTNYDAYADAMAKRFVDLGLTDATADNVAHYMPNADRALRGKTAVRNGDIRGALAPNAFADAVLGKIYVAHKNAFDSKKFTDYCHKMAEKAKNANK